MTLSDALIIALLALNVFYLHRISGTLYSIWGRLVKTFPELKRKEG